jgi:hypothetical protein
LSDSDEYFDIQFVDGFFELDVEFDGEECC